MRLDDREWKVFSLTGDDGLFPIHATSTGVDGIKLKAGDDVVLPYITRTETNNGIARFISTRNLEYGKDDGACITIGLDTQTAYWQPTDFITGQNIHVLRSDQLNYYSAQFLAVVLRQQMKSKFNWGGNGATLGRLKKLKIMLPVSDNGQPDYEFMEDYIRELMEQKRKQYVQYAEKQLEKLEKTNKFFGGGVHTNNNHEWKPFSVVSVFHEYERGKRLKKSDHKQGVVPYASSTGDNNGIDGFIEASEGTRIFHDCISLANSGSVGSAFYEPFYFVASDHVTHLKRSGLNKWHYLFLSCVLKEQSSNFNFNREINDARLKKMQIMLPVTDCGEPDYSFMETVGKTIMANKYKQYMSYVNHYCSQ